MAYVVQAQRLIHTRLSRSRGCGRSFDGSVVNAVGQEHSDLIM